MLFFEPRRSKTLFEHLRRDPPGTASFVAMSVVKTPLNLRPARLEQGPGCRSIGTSVDHDRHREDRGLFQSLINELGLRQPPFGHRPEHGGGHASKPNGRLPSVGSASVSCSADAAIGNLLRTGFPIRTFYVCRSGSSFADGQTGVDRSFLEGRDRSST